MNEKKVNVATSISFNHKNSSTPTGDYVEREEFDTYKDQTDKSIQSNTNVINTLTDGQSKLTTKINQAESGLNDLYTMLDGYHNNVHYEELGAGDWQVSNRYNNETDDYIGAKLYSDETFEQWLQSDVFDAEVRDGDIVVLTCTDGASDLKNHVECSCVRTILQNGENPYVSFNKGTIPIYKLPFRYNKDLGKWICLNDNVCFIAENYLNLSFMEDIGASFTTDNQPRMIMYVAMEPKNEEVLVSRTSRDYTIEVYWYRKK